MNTVNVLKDLKDFLSENVANEIKLKSPDDNNVNSYALVNPAVFIGWLPPKGYLPSMFESSIPCIVVGMDNGADNTKKSTIDLKISFATFSPGEYEEKEGQAFTPSFNGYIDLVNLIDKTKAALSKNRILASKYTLEDDIRFGMYEEQPYPYWYGFMTFSVKGSSYPITDIEKQL
ncbi:MAG: hypothetical protein FH761_17870 [Firmicutes bacterium]|nr:hypothetical protein [Bacillota bacterium]